eukprot:3263920-Pyramimonas_sp.AAC.1
MSGNSAVWLPDSFVHRDAPWTIQSIDEKFGRPVTPMRVALLCAGGGGWGDSVPRAKHGDVARSDASSTRRAQGEGEEVSENSTRR